MTVEQGIRFGRRFKTYCVWCLHHCEFAPCEHELLNLETTIQCPEFDDVYEMIWRWY